MLVNVARHCYIVHAERGSARVSQGAGMKQQWVGDDVWQQLDPRAGALTRGQRRRAVTATTAAAVILTAGYANDHSGLMWARAVYDHHSALESSISVKSHIIAQEIPVENTGWTTIRVTGIGQDGPGLRLVRPGDAVGTAQVSELRGERLPFDLHPGQTVILAIGYRVTDCDAVPSGPFPIAVRVDRPWGTQTISIPLPQQTQRPDDGASTSGPTMVVNPSGIEWQKAAADQACHPRLG